MMEIPIGEVREYVEPPSRTYALDVQAGRVCGMVDGIDAVVQAARKILLTPRFCAAYDTSYGCELKQTLANGASPAYLEAELPRQVEEALLQDSRILEVTDVEYERQGDELTVRVSIATVFGETEVMEVL